MYLGNKQNNGKKKVFNHFYKKSGVYFICLIVLFVVIGFLTTVAPAYRFSSHTITTWTSDLDSSTFLYLMGMENRAFKEAYPEDKALPNLSSVVFQMATSIKPNDTRSLLGQELPGFSTFENEIIIAGEGTNYTNLPVESAPPLDEILKDREAVVDDSTESEEPKKEPDTDTDKEQLDTGDKDVVFIYNTHNRESFLPHLPDVNDPDLAQHGEVNITKVSERLSKSLETDGIGTTVDDTDIMEILNNNGWKYGQSYTASRKIVQEAFTSNDDIQYVFDLHRDSQRRDKTTKVINGKPYAKIAFVVGAEHASHEKNLAFATKLHNLIEEKYPGLSRGVIKKKGPRSNGIYNQDLSQNSLVVEFGGVDNNLDELYRTADAVAEVFSELYWNAEKVNKNQ
ncbi:stage II sporulation protein P [Virgibacillus salinus]|uniref:Stage II sporulation protein P n=1 Tax=Virgibacillus salinus TaxID=553311 RepID=A0A1H1B934_9BACI|nr:stage II sporulation protein P [Virgibacillus salinus]SDQ48400.1 stage II sporulation protein P [Virgibacillus salinus]